MVNKGYSNICHWN